VSNRIHIVSEPAVGEIDPIRVELLSTEFPIHQVAKRGEQPIRILKRKDGGRVEMQWSVEYNPDVGAPGQLAYRLDTWVIKQRLGQLKRPFPRLVRIGDLREIARELKHGGDTNAIRVAFEQNSKTFIRARVAYRRTDGREDTLQGHFNRYVVFYRGYTLPSGQHAESVYISLNDPYYAMVSSAVTRPLDFAYMRRLTPSAQRFYELLSPRLFATIKHGRETASIRYSDYCQYAVQKRQESRRRMQIQMAAVQRTHLRSGYIGAVEYDKAPADDAGLDWILRYRPGSRARTEYSEFNERRSNAHAMPHAAPAVVSSILAKAPAEPRRDIHRGNAASPALALARRFAERRHGVGAVWAPTTKQVASAQAVLDALLGDAEAASVAVELAAADGRNNPKGFPAHISGVLEGGYVDRAIELRNQKRAAEERRAAAARESDRRNRYQDWCRERAASRLADLEAHSRERIVEEHLPEFLHRYRYYLRTKEWSSDDIRAWADPKILAEYGLEGAPSYDEWCRGVEPQAPQ
jgi:hypothetical protein